jgi:hypothetical protein
MPKRDIESLWDDVRVWLGDATRTAVKEAEDLTRRGRLKLELLRLSRDIEKAMAKLGGKVYDRMKKSPDEPVVADEDIRRVTRDIARLETELHAKQREYEAEKKR